MRAVAPHERRHVDELVGDRSTSAADVDDWDSLMHVTLVLRVESEFGVRFSSGEVSALSTVGDLMDLVEKSLGKLP